MSQMRERERGLQLFHRLHYSPCIQFHLFSLSILHIHFFYLIIPVCYYKENTGAECEVCCSKRTLRKHKLSWNLLSGPCCCCCCKPANYPARSVHKSSLPFTRRHSKLSLSQISRHCFPEERRMGLCRREQTPCIVFLSGALLCRESWPSTRCHSPDVHLL